MTYKETEIGLIPNDWNLFELKDKATITMGQSPKSEFYNNEGKGIPFMQGRTTFGEKYHEIDTWCTEPKRFAKKGDVLMSVRAPVGDVNIARMDLCIGRGLSSIRMNNGNNEFLFYLLKNYVESIVSRETGTVFGSINKDGLETLKLPFPSDKEQKAIADILAMLDEKIETNREIKRKLEDIAQAIFKYWFVDFEFADENGKPYKSSGGKMVESELGMIPKGWEVFKLTDFVSSISKSINKKEKKEAIFLNTSDILEGVFLHSSYSTTSEMPGQAKKLIQKNDILYSEIRPANRRFAYVYFDAEDYVVSTKLMVLRTDEQIFSSKCLYLFLKNNKTIERLHLAAESRSGTFPQITFKELAVFKFALPNKADFENNYKQIEDLIDLQHQITCENQKLLILRDTLLPKLMSGQIRVPLEN